jgi:hypothetical protein
VDRDDVVNGVAQWTAWWLKQRRAKVTSLGLEAMAINPFLLPLISALHGYSTVSELAAFQMSGHLAVGHATGFGKLIDEKVLPEVFGVSKLSAAFRRERELNASMFDEVDHIVERRLGPPDLLSLKAGRWTIQLTMAAKLNSSFAELIDARDRGEIEQFDKIVLGVMYGTSEGLTDKFRIVRGVETGKRHDTVDIRDDVDIYAGSDFWAWMNDGDPRTQAWVLEGILEGIKNESSDIGVASSALRAYEGAYEATLAKDIDPSTGEIDWQALLRTING